jgi:hypothetical protein
MAVTFNGTQTEAAELNSAVLHNCDCQRTPFGMGPKCPSHEMLNDQRALDHLLFIRRLRERLVREEEECSQ